MSMRKYTEDYENVVTTDEKGNEKTTAVYRGDYFEFDLDEAGIRRFKRNCLLLLIPIILLHISAGVVGNPGMYKMYISLPYVLAFFPLLYLATGILMLPKEKRKYRRDEVGLSYYRMRSSSLVLLIFLGIGLLGEIGFLVFGAADNATTLEILFIAFEVPAAGAVFFLINLQRKIRVQISEK